MRGGVKDGVTHKIEVWSEEGCVCVCLSALEGGDLSVTAVFFFFFPDDVFPPLLGSQHAA